METLRVREASSELPIASLRVQSDSGGVGGGGGHTRMWLVMQYISHST